jgi:hypothetical protein
VHEELFQQSRASEQPARDPGLAPFISERSHNKIHRNLIVTVT